MIYQINISTKKYPNTYVLVDFDIYQALNKFKWHKNSKGYAIRHQKTDGTIIEIRMHREIMNAKEGEQVDHINGNKLDNRKSNLRICSSQENNFNRKIGIKNTSGYKGVRLKKSRQKWESRITFDYKEIYLGNYENKEEAAFAYNVAAKKLYGKFANLNIILNEPKTTIQIKNKIENYLVNKMKT